MGTLVVTYRQVKGTDTKHKEDKTMFIIRDRETGARIEAVETYGEALETIEEYEEEDRKDGNYIEDYYEIVSDKDTKYIVMDYRDGDLFTEEFDNVAEAVMSADWDWSRLSEQDKALRTEFFVLESANPDVDAENHLDGDIVRRWK